MARKPFHFPQSSSALESPKSPESPQEGPFAEECFKKCARKFKFIKSNVIEGLVKVFYLCIFQHASKEVIDTETHRGFITAYLACSAENFHTILLWISLRSLHWKMWGSLLTYSGLSYEWKSSGHSGRSGAFSCKHLREEKHQWIF